MFRLLTVLILSFALLPTSVKASIESKWFYGRWTCAVNNGETTYIWWDLIDRSVRECDESGRYCSGGVVTDVIGQWVNIERGVTKRSPLRATSSNEAQGRATFITPLDTNNNNDGILQFTMRREGQYGMYGFISSPGIRYGATLWRLDCQKNNNSRESRSSRRSFSR